MSKRATLQLAGSLMAIAIAAPAAAQDGGDIIVTARRTEERLQDVPISITVVTPQEISNRNIVTTSDLGTYTPSLSVNSRFGPDKASFAIRGFSQDPATSPSVGVYFADVVAPRSAGATTGGSGSGPGAFFDLENIQVLKGPQGTLFGRNTTGGAVLLVPKKPGDTLGGFVEGTIGDYDQKRVQAAVNIPLADTFRVRLGFDRNKRDGYLKNRSGIGPDTFGDIDYSTFRGSIVAELTPELENYTIVNYTHSNTNGILPRVIGCNRAGDAFARAGCAQLDRQNARGDDVWDVENSMPDVYSKIDQWQIINTTTWLATDALTIKNIISYSEYREQTRYDIYGFNFPQANGAPFTYITSSNAPGQRNAAQSGFTEELQFQGRGLEDRLNWQAGLYYERSDPLSRSTAFNPIRLSCVNDFALQCSNGPYGSGALTSTSWTISVLNRAAYAQATYKLTDTLSVTGGARYTWDKTETSSENLRILFPAPNRPLLTCANSVRFPGTTPSVGRVVTDRYQCHLDLETSSKRPTWVIDLEYKPTSDAMLYAKWSRGYRQGFINPNVVAFEAFGPEKVDTYEVGAKASFTGAVRGYLNIAAFYNNFGDQQLQVNALPRPGSGIAGANVTVNAGKSVIKGVEIDGSIRPLQGLQLDVGYAFLDTKLKSIDFPAIDPNSPYLQFVPPLVGEDLPLTPKHRVTLTGSYQLPLAESIGQIKFGATYTYTDTQNAVPRLLASGAVNPFAVLPSSELLNLNVNWDNVLGGPVDLSAFVTNVTNERVRLNLANGYASTGVEAAIYGPPRMFGVRARYRFGD